MPSGTFGEQNIIDCSALLTYVDCEIIVKASWKDRVAARKLLPHRHMSRRLWLDCAAMAVNVKD